MKVLTLNTHSWMEEMQIPKLYTLARMLVDEHVDIIAVQEVNQSRCMPPAADLPGWVSADGALDSIPVHRDNYALLLVRALHQLAPEIPWQWSWIPVHLGFGVFDEGVAVISRHEITEAIQLSHGGGFDYEDVRRRASLAVRSAGLWWVSSHFSWWRDDTDTMFAREWRHVSSSLDRLVDIAPVVLCGDFNVPAGLNGGGYDYVMRSGRWSDSFYQAREVHGEATVHTTIHGWDDNEQALRIDYVFTSPGVEATRHSVVFPDTTAEALSDHSGIVVELEPTCGASPRHLTA
ncbi:Maltose 6'-phosphate phosphatase [Corynebacterium ciconiae DSM 44920]|uniref:endonuclease/exonuclease/phosphatase family protein n=1 Tax=Corynebacterium ciconiae TaxID=227319 RepID=UPI00037FF464|nr:endonuclease/exonuclease/phosphatase family protein [Corynebacterium ciconiae]WKD61208.1 Maltose 6'-phosphate phosphatase [Corynebacterium ciconiae DSM 44920]